jgi:hypothetical protein
MLAPPRRALLLVSCTEAAYKYLMSTKSEFKQRYGGDNGFENFQKFISRLKESYSDHMQA